MALNSTTLNTDLLRGFPQAVTNVFNSASGIATQLSTALINITGSGGTLNTEQNTLNAQYTALQSQQTAENIYLDSYQASLQKQYASMQTSRASIVLPGRF